MLKHLFYIPVGIRTSTMIKFVYLFDIHGAETITASQAHAGIPDGAYRWLSVFRKGSFPIVHQASIVVVKRHGVHFVWPVLTKLRLHPYSNIYMRNEKH